MRRLHHQTHRHDVSGRAHTGIPGAGAFPPICRHDPHVAGLRRKLAAIIALKKMRAVRVRSCEKSGHRLLTRAARKRTYRTLAEPRVESQAHVSLACGATSRIASAPIARLRSHESNRKRTYHTLAEPRVESQAHVSRERIWVLRAARVSKRSGDT